MYAWRTKAIGDIAYSRRKVSDQLQEFDEENIYFQNAMAAKMPEKFMGCGVECKKEGNKISVDGTVMHLWRHNAWTGRVRPCFENWPLTSICSSTRAVAFCACTRAD